MIFLIVYWFIEWVLVVYNKVCIIHNRNIRLSVMFMICVRNVETFKCRICICVYMNVWVIYLNMYLWVMYYIVSMLGSGVQISLLLLMVMVKLLLSFCRLWGSPRLLVRIGWLLLIDDLVKLLIVLLLLIQVVIWVTIWGLAFRLTSGSPELVIVVLERLLVSVGLFGGHFRSRWHWHFRVFLTATTKNCCGRVLPGRHLHFC